MAKITGQSNTGPQGPTGATGADGMDGVDGVDGVNGLSAYEVAVANGFVGDEAAWLASLVGPAGPVSSVDGQTGDVDLSGDYAALSHSHIATDISSGTFADSFIPDLDAAKITTGVFDAARLPADPYAATYAPLSHNHTAAQITSGTLADARIPSLAASKITSGTMSISRLPTGTTSSTLALGNRGVPAGGFLDQALSKSSGTDYALAWRTMPFPYTKTAQATAGMVSMTADQTLATVNTNVLVPGQTYLIQATGWMEGYGSGGALGTGMPSLNIDGSVSIAPTALTFEAGVDGTKIQWHSAYVAGSDATVPISLGFIYGGSGSVTIVWAKVVAIITPVP